MQKDTDEKVILDRVWLLLESPIPFQGFTHSCHNFFITFGHFISSLKPWLSFQPRSKITSKLPSLSNKMEPRVDTGSLGSWFKPTHLVLFCNFGVLPIIEPQFSHLQSGQEITMLLPGFSLRIQVDHSHRHAHHTYLNSHANKFKNKALRQAKISCHLQLHTLLTTYLL